MATMVKEKRREKKKTKEKSKVTSNTIEDVPMNVSETITEEIGAITGIAVDQVIKAATSEKIENCEKTVATTISKNQKSFENKTGDSVSCTEKPEVGMNASQTSNLSACESNTNLESIESVKYESMGSATSVENATDNYARLNRRLECMTIPDTVEPVSEARELELAHPDAYLKPSVQTVSEFESAPEDDFVNVVPSAPTCEEEAQPLVARPQVMGREIRTKLQAMPLEEAVNMFGGAEMEAVKMMSEKEEANVEAGPTSGPEHPLVDLLSTFRSSLRALENERSRLTCGYIEEEKSRSTLWKIEKRYINEKKQCKCGTNIDLWASYEHAEFMRDRLPVARLRLEGLLRDVQDSYCHHQHAALLTHCQIDEFISETVEGNNREAMREALSLLLQALRAGDGAAPAALRRWAAALVAALLDDRDVSQLLFVLHHLFRQSRSVRWAARALRLRVADAAEAPRALAALDVLLAGGRLDDAAECTEEASESAWEEVSASGAGGAVGGGALREMDLLALLRAFPRRDLLARLLLFPHADVRAARDYEWGDARGGRDVLRACCGVRALLAVLRRAAHAHAHYSRLRAALTRLAAAALQGLACLYQAPRAPYEKDLEVRIQAELEACFAEGLPLFGPDDLPELPTELLGEQSAKDYCLTLMVGLHDAPREPAPAQLRCAGRVSGAAHAAARRRDLDLARLVMDFLVQTGCAASSSACGSACARAARAWLAPLLAAHPRLRTAALLALAHRAQVEPLEPGALAMAAPSKWRPAAGEARDVIAEWERRCPRLLAPLLLLLDYTPFTGVSVEVQREVGRWACARGGEEGWQVLARLRPHAACWRALGDAPPPDPPPADLLSAAFALLASSWGHSIPEICSEGVEALLALASARPGAAAHCLAPVMLVMAHSPESIDLTPKFGEVFSTLARSGPGAVQRVLGRGGPSGAELLLRLMLHQLEGDLCEAFPRGRVVRAWLHALGRVAGAAGALDTALLATRDWPALDEYAASLVQEPGGQEAVSAIVRGAGVAPLLCESVLRAQARREAAAGLAAALADALAAQRAAARRIHVDDALQSVSPEMPSEQLAVYRSGAAALAAPAPHPAHLLLWRLFFHLYLQRPPGNMRDSAAPVGPWFYSGLIKSRTLAQIKKRLQETAAFHRDRAAGYARAGGDAPSRRPSGRVESGPAPTEKVLFPELSSKDLTGESSDSDSDVSEDSETGGAAEEAPCAERDSDETHAFDLARYHRGAERMVRECLAWLQDGEQVRAAPHHADVARFISDQALEAAWRHALSRGRPPPSPEPPPPLPAPAPPAPPPPAPAPLQRAVAALMALEDSSRTRSVRAVRSLLGAVDAGAPRALLAALDALLADIAALAEEWSSEVSRTAVLDGRLWQLVGELRVPRPLRPVTKHCPGAGEHRCQPVVFHVNKQEWCVSPGAEQAVTENRASSRAALRRLARARPAAARAAAALLSLARRIRDKAAAVSAVERAWRAAGGAARGTACGVARDALVGFVETLAERWLHRDAAAVASLLSRWCAGAASPLQHALCGLLLAPRRLEPDKWPLIYTALLEAKLPPHTKFSYLSKFEMGPWSRSACSGARRELAAALVGAQGSKGAAPPAKHGMLLELLALHTAALLAADNLHAVLLQLATLAAEGRLPPRQWAPVLAAAGAVGGTMTFDQLGQLLRSLGALWWRARSQDRAALAPHAAGVAALLALLLRGLVAAAARLTYQPERVGRCAWGALQESWAAWVTPLPTVPPLLPSLAAEGESEYSIMLRCFHSCLKTIMDDCPGSEIPLLQSTFEWCVVTHATCARAGAGAAAQESRVQASELLATLAALPWDDHQWFYGNCLQIAVQVCDAGDAELALWAGERWRGAAADTLLRDAGGAALASRLAALLHLLTAAPSRCGARVLQQATRLPWWALPEEALGEALQRFFAAEHSPARAYHDLPHFPVLLHASELRLREPAPAAYATSSRDKRALALSQWARAAAAPPLLAHVAQHARCVLQTVTDLAPHLAGAEGELEALLGRAAVIMCLEPAAAAALPVWQQWVRGAAAPLAGACLAAASALTALPYCAALADDAARALLDAHESGWGAVVARWSPSPWRAAHVFAERARLHAAYACARTLPPAPAADALRALLAADIHFAEDEAIVAVWICCAGRAAREAGEGGGAARALLAAWAAPPRRSLLRLVSLQPDAARPTARHRLLCLLAECIVSPSAERVAAYEAACGAASGQARGAIEWGGAAHAALLPQLAARLYPQHERYFRYELEAVADSDRSAP